MTLSIISILAGFAILIWAADRFVIGAAALANNWGISPLLIGLTIVGLGTSAPEIVVSTMSSMQGNPGLAIGNALGSNIANIGLILGITALVCPLAVRSEILKREYPILLIVTLLSYWLLADHFLDLMDASILIAGLIIVIFTLIWLAQHKSPSDPLPDEFAEEIPNDMPNKTAIFWFMVGLIGLLISSRMLVWGAVNIAQAFGVSDLVIGLTIVAIGTSLPELAASISSAFKGEHDIAIGNIIGSNLYNLLAVLPIPGFFATTIIDPEVISRDLPVMLILTLALLAMGLSKTGKGIIGRFKGLLLTATFIGYQAFIYIGATAT